MAMPVTDRFSSGHSHSDSRCSGSTTAFPAKATDVAAIITTAHADKDVEQVLLKTTWPNNQTEGSFMFGWEFCYSNLKVST